MELNEKQLQAINNATKYKLSIINGGAGTGKTTIIKEIVKKLDAQGETIKLVAPTGKASSRLREASGIPTSTLHSFMRYNGEGFMLKSASIYSIIIDESSMLDSFLLYSLIELKPYRIILVGDQAQLFPVGNGSPFHDIIKFDLCPVTTLDKCYRNSEAIFHNAILIRNKKLPQTQSITDNEKWFIQNMMDIVKIEDKIMSFVKQGKLDFQKDIILVTRNGSEDQPCTRKSLNKKIALELKLWDATSNHGFVVGARIICTKNFSEYDTYNGTTGTITGIDEVGNWWVKGDIPFIDNGVQVDEILFKKEVRKECELAYALTVHKSQGSQYNKVIFVCLAQDSYIMLNNSLIYTAVTRAREVCYIIGSHNILNENILKDQNKNTIISLLAKKE